MRTTLRLTLDVTFDTTTETRIGDLEDNLLAMGQRSLREGLFTADTDAEVVIANPRVEVLE